jgi:hypothetical protein
MRGTVWLTLGWVGFGANAGTLPELRLGLVALGCCPGALRERVDAFARAVAEAIRTLGKGR